MGGIRDENLVGHDINCRGKGWGVGGVGMMERIIGVTKRIRILYTWSSFLIGGMCESLRRSKFRGTFRPPWPHTWSLETAQIFLLRRGTIGAYWGMSDWVLNMERSTVNFTKRVLTKVM